MKNTCSWTQSTPIALWSQLGKYNFVSLFVEKLLKRNSVIFRGIGYERVVLNLLKVYCDPANLIIVINAADYEEKYYRSQLEAKYVHESSTNSNER